MSRFTYILNVVFGFLLMLGIGALIGYSANSYFSQIFSSLQGKELPSFTVVTLDGNEIASEDLLGEPLVLALWSRECVFCAEQFDDLGELRFAFPETLNIVVVERAAADEARQFLDERTPADILFLLDPNDNFHRAIGGFSMPQILIVRKDGTVAHHERGPLSFDAMSALVATQLDKPAGEN